MAWTMRWTLSSVANLRSQQSRVCRCTRGELLITAASASTSSTGKFRIQVGVLALRQDRLVRHQCLPLKVTAHGTLFPGGISHIYCGSSTLEAIVEIDIVLSRLSLGLFDGFSQHFDPLANGRELETVSDWPVGRGPGMQYDVDRGSSMLPIAALPKPLFGTTPITNRGREARGRCVEQLHRFDEVGLA